MERLAKEKISSQNRILVLKREMSQWGDVDFSRLAPDTDAITTATPATNGSATPSPSSERDLLHDPPGIAPGRNGIRYSSSSSLSSVATTASSIGNLPLQTTISPVLVAASSSPSRASPPSATMARSSSSPTAAMPLSLTTKPDHLSPLKLNGLNLTASNGTIPNDGVTTTLPLMTVGSQSQLFTPVTTILTTGNGSSFQSLPLNLNVAAASNGHHLSGLPPQNGLITSTSSGLQIIGTSSNGSIVTTTTNGKELINGTTVAATTLPINGTTATMTHTKNGLRTTMGTVDGVVGSGNKIEIIATSQGQAAALEPPATKVIKLVNGNTIVGLTSMDKDKMMLSQVVQQGGIVVSPIQLLTSTQGLRVIQQAPNGLATIELSSPTNVQSQPSQVHRTTGGNNGLIVATSNSSSAAAATPAHHLHHHQHLSSQTIQTHHHHHHQQVTGAQLHKLLLSNGTTATTSPSPNAVTPELARLPGGAELNILPASAAAVVTAAATTTATLPLYRTTIGPVQHQQQQIGGIGIGGKQQLTFVNAIAGNGAGLTLKGTDVSPRSTTATALHVVQSSSGGVGISQQQLSSLTPVVVSRYSDLHLQQHHQHHHLQYSSSTSTSNNNGHHGTADGTSGKVLVSRN